MNKEKIKEVFKNYPGHKEIYATSDENVFLDKIQAQNHADIIGGGVETFKRDESPAEEISPEPQIIRRQKKSETL